MNTHCLSSSQTGKLSSLRLFLYTFLLRLGCPIDTIRISRCVDLLATHTPNLQAQSFSPQPRILNRTPHTQACTHTHALCAEVPDEVANCGDLALAVGVDLSLAVTVRVQVPGFMEHGVCTFGGRGGGGAWYALLALPRLGFGSLLPVLEQAQDHTERVDCSFTKECCSREFKEVPK